MMQQFVLSEYGRLSTVPSPVNRMMAAFASDFRDGVDVNLGVGYINESTIPGSLMTDAMGRILQTPQTYRLPFNYGGPEGTAGLREAIFSYLVHGRRDVDAKVLERHRIGIGASGATSLLDAIAHVLPRGIVITTDPMYYIYCETLGRLGFEVVAIPEDDDGMRMDLLAQQLEAMGTRRSEIQFFYVVSVNNPTCTVLSATRRVQLLDTVKRLSKELNRAVPLVLDRAYEDLIHQPGQPRPGSLLSHSHDGLVYELGTLSKVLAPSLRIGYIVGADGPFMDALVQRTSDVGFSAPVLTQSLASYMLSHHIDEQLARVNGEYQKKAALTREMIVHHLGNYIEHVTGGSAGFYFYLTFRHITTGPASRFFRYCTRTTDDAEVNGQPRHRRVVYIPGEYCVHPQGALVEAGKRQLRLSYGFESMARIEAGLQTMSEAAEYALRETR